MYHMTDPFHNLPHLRLDKTYTNRILLLTHTDMDGSGPAVVLKAAMPDTITIDVQHCSNDTMSKDILYAVTNENVARKYDLIIACDISCTLDAAEHINYSDNRYKFVLLDHHDTALELNKFEWACVCPKLIDNEYYHNAYGDKFSLGHSSGTSLMFDYLRHYDFIGDHLTVNSDIDVNVLRCLVDLIMRYDTWDFNDIFEKEDMKPYELNQVFEGMGSEIFEKHMYKCCTKSNKNIAPTERIFDDIVTMVLGIEQSKIKTHKEIVRKRLINGMITLDNKPYSMVYCYTDRYLQAAFETMQDEYPDSDLYAINYGTGVSVRTRKPEIHVGKLLKGIGGGGHAGAGGLKISSEKQKEYIESAFKAEIKPTQV